MNLINLCINFFNEYSLGRIKFLSYRIIVKKCLAAYFLSTFTKFYMFNDAMFKDNLKQPLS